MRRFKIAVCFALVLLLLAVPVVVYADDETTQAETSETSEGSGSSETDYVLHIRTCRHLASVFVGDGIINSDSYYYICYNNGGGYYDAYISTSPFAIESSSAWIMEWYGANNRYDWFSHTDQIASSIQVCGYSGAYNGPFGTGGCLRCNSNVVHYRSDDGVFYSELGNVVGRTVYSTIIYRDDELTFFDFGLKVPEIVQEGFYPIDFSEVYSNFVPYVYLEGTNVNVNFAGFTATDFSDIPPSDGSGGLETSDTSETSEESSFFQVSRIPRTMEVAIWRALPAALLILIVVILLRILPHFGGVR